MMAPNGPASARNSPMLPRSAPKNDFSPLPPDFLLEEEYKTEKDRVIGELASRIRGRKPQGQGFDKNKRGEGECYHDDFLTLSSSSPYPSTPPLRRARDKSEDPPSSAEAFLELSAKPIPKKLNEEDLLELNNPQTAVKVSSVTSSASINPTRVATASIKLQPSPKVERKERGRNANRSNVANININNSVRTRSQSPRMSRLAPPNHSNGSLSSRSSSRSTTPSSTSRSGSGYTGTNGTSNGYTNRLLTTPAGRHMTQRSISLQPPSRAKQAAQNSQRTRVPSGTSARSSAAANGGFRRAMSVDPDLNDPEIQARIGNRATKVVNKSIGSCGACKKAITEDGCTAFGKVYHKNCFKCVVCKQKIQGKFFEKDGKPYCAKDYQKTQEACTVCKLPIKGDSVVCTSKSFHPECMKCFVCGDSLRGTYLTFQDKPICERDYKQYADKCSSCGESISGTYYSLNNQTLCQECHGEQLDKCPKCEEVISGKMVKITGASYHPECFTCVECDKNMINIPFVADDKKKIYCPSDYNKKKAPKCSFCKKPIVPKEGQKTAPRLRALQRDFHPECFQCEDCGLVFDSRVKGRECYPFKNHLYCLKCNRKKLSSSESEDDTDDDVDDQF